MTNALLTNALRSASLAIAITLALAIAACTSPTAPHATALPHSPAFGIYDATRPAPVIISAVRVDASTVQLTFVDNAEDETFASAYFTSAGDTGPTSTSNPIFTPMGTGERVVDVYAPADKVYVRLDFAWGPFPTTDTSLRIWGPFSERAEVTAAIITTATACKAHGKCKP
jgi:hypothetical protein